MRVLRTGAVVGCAVAWAVLSSASLLISPAQADDFLLDVTQLFAVDSPAGLSQTQSSVEILVRPGHDFYARVRRGDHTITIKGRCTEPPADQNVDEQKAGAPARKLAIEISFEDKWLDPADPTGRPMTTRMSTVYSLEPGEPALVGSNGTTSSATPNKRRYEALFLCLNPAPAEAAGNAQDATADDAEAEAAEAERRQRMEARYEAMLLEQIEALKKLREEAARNPPTGARYGGYGAGNGSGGKRD